MGDESCSLICCVIIICCGIIGLIFQEIMYGKRNMNNAKWKRILKKNKDISNDKFNDLFWLTYTQYNKYRSRYNDYGIFVRICPFCQKPYTRIFYKRLTYKPSINLYELIKSNWSNKVEYNIYGIDYLLYSSLKDLINNQNAWESCQLNNDKIDGIGFPGLCYEKMDSRQDNQYSAWDNNKLIERKGSKYWVLRRFALPKKFKDDLYKNNPISDYVYSTSPTPSPNYAYFPTSEPTLEPTFITSKISFIDNDKMETETIWGIIIGGIVFCIIIGLCSILYIRMKRNNNASNKPSVKSYSKTKNDNNTDDEPELITGNSEIEIEFISTSNVKLM